MVQAAGPPRGSTPGYRPPADGGSGAGGAAPRASLLVLDTRLGDPSNDLYVSLGYQWVGQIPHYARSGSGSLDTTVLYYKDL